MAGISVGSVTVEVVPDARGFHRRLAADVVPAAETVGDEIGRLMGERIGRELSRSLPGAIREGGRDAASQAAAAGDVIGRGMSERISRQVRQGITDGVRDGGRSATPSATRSGNEAGGAFARAMKTRIEAAMRAIGDIAVGADTSEAEADIQALRVRLEALRNARIGVDIDAASARAQIDEIKAEITRLGAEHPNVDVRVNSAAAVAELEALEAEINRLDGQNPTITPVVNTGPAMAGILGLSVALAGVAAIPIVPILGAGLGGLTAALGAAGAGFGGLAAVALPALSSIKKATDAQKASTQSATGATNQGAQKALAMAGAQQQLAAATRNAAYNTAQALRGVQNAEQGLAQAQHASLAAQKAVNDARTQAKMDLEDLNNQLIDAGLGQRRAVLQLAEAKRELDNTLANPGATAVQRQQAQLAYEEAAQGLTEQNLALDRLKDKKAEANKSGIEGSKAVVAAKDAETQADQRVTEAEQALADAKDNVTRVAQQNADAIASARRAIEAASLSASQGASTQSKLGAAMAALSPAARQLMTSWQHLTGAFKAWSASLQPAVLPLFSRAIDGLAASLGKFTPLVLGAVGGVKELQDRFSAQMKTPFWHQFLADLTTSVRPAIVGLGVAFGNIFKGMAGVIDAFLPHMDGISASMQRITGRFAAWGTGLKGSPGFERFLDYAKTSGPIVAHALGDIGGAFLSISKALSPISGPLLSVLGTLARGVDSLARNFPWLVQGLYAAYVASKVLKIGMAALNVVMDANPITLIVIAIAVLVAGLIWAYQHVTWFREGVQAAWKWIQEAISFAWNDVIKPVFDAISLAVRVLIAVFLTVLVTPMVIYFNILKALFTWLWQNAAKPALSGIGALFTWLWQNAIKPAMDGIGALFTWLWRNIIKPVWDGISTAINYAWTRAIKPIFDLLKSGVKSVGDSFQTAVDFIGRAWDRLKDVTRRPVQFVVDTVWNNGVLAVWNSVAGLVGLNKLNPIRFATGGLVPGYAPGKDIVPALLSPGEGILMPQTVRALGGGPGIAALNSWGSGKAAPGYASGGIVQRFAGGGIVDWIKRGASGIADLASSAAGVFLGGVKDFASKAFGPVLDLVKNIPLAGQWGDAIARVPGKLVGGMLSLFGKKDAEVPKAAAVGAGGGAARWAPVVLQALQLLGQPASWLSVVLRRLNQESGGSQGIVNLWDSNAKRGTPSVGLMQVIGPTFRAYAGRFAGTGPFLYGTSIDPLANIYAGLNYALHRYGSLSALNRPGGYDSGGYLPPGISTVFNGTGRPEPVLTGAQWDAIQNSAAAGGGDIQVKVYVGDREITDIVRTEVRGENTRLIRTMQGF